MAPPPAARWLNGAVLTDGLAVRVISITVVAVTVLAATVAQCAAASRSGEEAGGSGRSHLTARYLPAGSS